MNIDQLVNTLDDLGADVEWAFVPLFHPDGRWAELEEGE